MAKNTKKEVNTEKPKPIRPPKKTEQSLRVNFTEKELLEIGKRLAEANRELEAAESEKKSIAGTLKAKCDSIASRISLYSGELTNGYTYRQIPCEIRFDSPDRGQKQTVRLDSGEIIETAAMTLHEMQGELAIGDTATNHATATITINGKTEHPPLRTVSGDGVVVTKEDDGAFIDEDEIKN